MQLTYQKSRGNFVYPNIPKTILKVICMKSSGCLYSAHGKAAPKQTNQKLKSRYYAVLDNNRLLRFTQYMFQILIS